MKFDKLRPSLQMLSLVGEIDEFKGAWLSLSRISPERLSALKHVATIESVGASTRIEGAALTDQQVEALLNGLKINSFQSRDEEEVAGYAELMKTIFENWKLIDLSENQIKQLHGTLLKYSQKDERHKGKYKTVPNNVEAFENGKSIGIVFKTASQFETPFKMTELVDWTREAMTTKTFHPLLIVAVFAVTFLAIHPFQDGNGRLSRALTTLLLLKLGYLYVPYSSLESVIEANKESYYLALRRTQTTLENNEPDWDSWILFFLQSMQKQKAQLEAKISREKLLQGDLPELGIRILELIRQHGSLKMSEIETFTGESRSANRTRINELVQRGDIKRNGRGPSTWYSVAL
jgi:Fic family protein